MATAERLRSSLPLFQKILRSDALSTTTTQRWTIQRSWLCPTLTNPQPLPAEEEKELKETVPDIIGQGKKIDPSILAGLVVEFEQKVFDMSIKTRARQMERFLREPINVGNP